jgi:hypothetical protein
MVAYLTAAGGNPSALATALIALGGAIFGALNYSSSEPARGVSAVNTMTR